MAPGHGAELSGTGRVEAFPDGVLAAVIHAGSFLLTPVVFFALQYHLPKRRPHLLRETLDARQTRSILLRGLVSMPIYVLAAAAALLSAYLTLGICMAMGLFYLLRTAGSGVRRAASPLYTLEMPIELKSMLCRVTGEVFGRGFIVVEDASRENPPQYSVLVRNCGTGLAAVIRIDLIRLDVDFPDHDVRTGIVDDDDNEAGKEAELHRLCRLFRSGTTPVVHVEADGQRWQIGRRVSRVPNP